MSASKPGRESSSRQSFNPASRQGAETVQQIITTQAEAGVPHERMAQQHQDTAAYLFSEATTPDGIAFAREYDNTAATLLSELRELDRPEPNRTPGTPHPDPFLAERGWQVCEHGIYVRGREADRQPDRELEAG